MGPAGPSSRDFIGAPTVYDELGSERNAGAGLIYGNLDTGLIYGNLDTGVWPEHPSFADQGNLAAPPPRADGTPRTCRFGECPAAARRRHTPHLQVRRQPAHAGCGPVCLPAQADRRRGLPRHLRHRLRRRELQGNGTRLRRPRHPHRVDVGRQRGRQRDGARRRPGHHRWRGAGRPRHRVPGVRPPRLLQLRHVGRRGGGDPRRGRRHQLLDIRRHEPVHRPHRAGVPRRLRP